MRRLHVALILAVAVVALALAFVAQTQPGEQVERNQPVITETVTPNPPSTVSEPARSGDYTRKDHVQQPAGEEASPGEASEYIEFVDLLGRVVKVERYPSRVAAIGPGALRLLAYLGSLDLVVGVEELELRSPLGRDYAMAYGEYLSKLPVVGPGGPGNPPDPERIRNVNPDLVVMSLTYAQLYDPDRLSNEVGAPVIVADYGVAGYLNISYLKDALTLLGRVLNREAKAEELRRYLDSIVGDLSARTMNLADRPSVYVAAVSYKGPQPFTSSQALFPPLVLLSTPSVVDSLSSRAGFISVDFEYVLSAQPDYVFIDLNNLGIVLDDFTKDPAKYCALRAFKEHRVYSILPFNYYHTNIATALADAYFMGKVLYPERFADVDPAPKANEVFKVFLGKELYDLFVEGYGVGFANVSHMFSCHGA